MGRDGARRPKIRGIKNEKGGWLGSWGEKDSLSSSGNQMHVKGQGEV